MRKNWGYGTAPRSSACSEHVGLHDFTPNPARECQLAAEEGVASEAIEDARDSEMPKEALIRLALKLGTQDDLQIMLIGANVRADG